MSENQTNYLKYINFFFEKSLLIFLLKVFINNFPLILI